jgi:hypothetical protein
MTKMQIAAKAAFFALGVQIAAQVCGAMPMYVSVLPHADWRIHGVVELIVLSVVLVLIFRWLIIGGDALAFRLIDDSGQPPENAQRQWLIISLHFACFFSGLVLLTQTSDLFAKVILMPFKLRGFFNRVIWAQSWSELFQFSTNQVAHFFVKGLKAVAAIYLLIGASHFVRRQLRRTERFVTRSLSSVRSNT